MHNLLELLCLVDNLVDFLLDYLELPMFINASLPLNTLLNDVDRTRSFTLRNCYG